MESKTKRRDLDCFVSIYGLGSCCALTQQATDHAPRISNLNLCVLRSSAEEQYPAAIKRLRMTGRRSSTPDLRWVTRSYEKAWKNYIHGNIVSDYSARIIKKFLTLMAGTGELEHDDDSVKSGKLNREQLGDP